MKISFYFNFLLFQPTKKKKQKRRNEQNATSKRRRLENNPDVNAVTVLDDDVAQIDTNEVTNSSETSEQVFQH